MGKPVTVRDAPGLAWSKYAGDRYEARWRCRADIIARGYGIKSVRLWIGTEPTKEEWDFIADTCVSLQQEMLVYANGGPPSLEGEAALDGTLRSLIRCYRTDKDSGYSKKRYGSRRHYDTLFKGIEESHGDQLLANLKARMFYRWHDDWNEGGKTSIGKAKIGMMRLLLNYGAALLEDPDCLRLATGLRTMRFKNAKPRTERLTSDQVIAIRAKAHELGRPSIALAQAFQFECMFRQKDVIGEYVPMKEPGISAVTKGKSKWLHGLRWEEIDANLILSHTTSKRGKPITVNLKNAPMVMEELARQFGDAMPAKGPIVVEEKSGLPWDTTWFRQNWRKLADACGIPKSVKNMDTRAGAISEATDAGAQLEHVRHAATHSDIAMTQRYSRNSDDKIVSVQLARLEHRNKPKT